MRRRIEKKMHHGGTEDTEVFTEETTEKKRGVCFGFYPLHPLHPGSNFFFCCLARMKGMGCGFLSRVRSRPLKKVPSHGFTLIEAAVAIAIVAILAGAIAPLAVKALNQQREFRTRESLKACFEGMFGARDRRVANMRADFGWDPGASLNDLSAMVVRTGTSGPGAIIDFASDSQGLFFGYNGPYWNGTVNSSNQPLDGWGNPLRLRWFTATNSWQVFSLGANNADDTTIASTTPLGDDLAFPIVPAPVQSFKAGLILNISKVSTVTGMITVTDRLDGATHTVSLTGTPSTLSPGYTTQTYSCNPVSGGVKITITRSSGTSPVYFVLDLLPGEVRQFDVTI